MPATFKYHRFLHKHIVTTATTTTINNKKLQN
jgi:hypothetical protein